MTTAYDRLNNLPELSFIAGTDKVLTFTCYDEDSSLLDITGGTVLWYLCPFGQYGVNILTVSGVVATANTFTVTLTAVDTLSLSGKYIQQVVITDFDGYTFRPGQGIVLILPAIPSA
jgi:hypothetical protein